MSEALNSKVGRFLDRFIIVHTMTTDEFATIIHAALNDAHDAGLSTEDQLKGSRKYHRSNERGSDV
jgi:hypothetical protein